jgi:hypothetical protein
MIVGMIELSEGQFPSNSSTISLASARCHKRVYLSSATNQINTEEQPEMYYFTAAYHSVFLTMKFVTVIKMDASRPDK